MPAIADDARPHKRKGFWYLIRRVPREFVAFADRPRIQISTGIRIVDDPRACRAREAVTRLNAELVRYWEGKRADRIPMRRDDTLAPGRRPNSWVLPTRPSRRVWPSLSTTS
jgi:hypothetical protein